MPFLENCCDKGTRGSVVESIDVSGARNCFSFALHLLVTDMIVIKSYTWTDLILQLMPNSKGTKGLSPNWSDWCRVQNQLIKLLNNLKSPIYYSCKIQFRDFLIVDDLQEGPNEILTEKAKSRLKSNVIRFKEDATTSHNDENKVFIVISYCIIHIFEEFSCSGSNGIYPLKF